MERELTGGMIESLAEGCAVLGAGGGGETYIPTLAVRQALSDHGPVRLVTIDDLPDDGIVLPIGEIGAPTIGLEKLPDIAAAARLIEVTERRLGGKVVALMPTEIGGGNGLMPIAWAAAVGLPVVDADCMGRAFPEMQMVSPNVLGFTAPFCALTDIVGNVITLDTVSMEWMERLCRGISVVTGSSATESDCAMTVAQARDLVLHGTVSLALRIGQSLDGPQPLAGLIESVGARRLMTGKVTEVEQRLGDGFARGSVTVEETNSDTDGLLRLEVQNENLVAFIDGEVVATVPDLICVVDSHSGQAIATENVRYGQRVTVIAFESHPVWRTERGLEIAGPRAFGFDFDYLPIQTRATELTEEPADV